MRTLLAAIAAAVLAPLVWRRLRRVSHTQVHRINPR